MQEEVYCTVFAVLMDTNCNLLGLQKAQFSLLHCFISDCTSRYYNPSSYTEFWPSNIFLRSGPLMYSVLNGGSQLTGY
jgi:hypothetical protein